MQPFGVHDDRPSLGFNDDTEFRTSLGKLTDACIDDSICYLNVLRFAIYCTGLMVISSCGFNDAA